MTMVYFGAAWDTPALNGTLQVGTPIGRTCTSCREVIVRGDRGFIEILDVINNDPETGKVTHIHAECRLDEMVGHLIGLCVCRFIPAGRHRAREVWSHFFDDKGQSLWPQTTMR